MNKKSCNLGNRYLAREFCLGFISNNINRFYLVSRTLENRLVDKEYGDVSKIEKPYQKSMELISVMLLVSTNK
jgi:hypothetical protein